MKKIFSIILLFLSLCGLFMGCKEKKIYRIGVAQCSTDDWRTKMNDEILREIMLHEDAEVEIRSADDDSNKQIEDIKYFVNNGFDMVIVAPNEADALTPVIDEIYASGMPVIIFDRNIKSQSYTSRIGVDNVRIGKSAARYALHLEGDSLKVIEIYGLMGSTPANDRHEGFSKTLEESGGVILASVPANWKQELAEPVADSLLRLYPEANLIFAHNDRMAIGASKMAKNIGRDDIKIIGIDAAPGIGIKAVADSLIDATFLYPTEGHLIIREALKILRGEPYSKELILPMASAVDSSNADILLLQNETLADDTRKIQVLKGLLDDYWQKHSAQTSLFYAIIAILLLLFGVLFLVLRMFWQTRRYQDTLMSQNKLLEEERDKQKELNVKLEEATQSKLVFFTNVSHDLRTPLTLIAEPIAQLNNASNLEPQQKTLMKIANKNVKILHRLINQILDFRKYENNRLELHLTEIDLRKVIREWMEAFYAAAKKRDIDLKVVEPEGDSSIPIALDVEKIERVFFNLISNALKYSPDNSSITVIYEIKDDNLILKVADTGEGISERDMGHIFDRFFQVEHVRPRGSGIGLSLAKAFVELHGGSISVESELKKGSVFTVIIPVRHVADEVMQIESGITQEDVDSEVSFVETKMEFDEGKPLILIIDDNPDIREMVTELMKQEYNVITASNGKEGIKRAIKYVPDLIISDVMMPGMDGIECCTRLKTETVTSHIPVLMLTACSMDEQRVQGFESGADGYLAKPFSSSVLKAQVGSLIANRRRIRDIYGKTPSSKADTEKVQEKKSPKKHDTEDEFYERFLNVFEKNISDSSLSVDTVASELGFERSQLYRKIKSITNYSPVELMRNIRLKRARTLLTSTDKTISEIAYEVGFATPAYFTKCYRDMYGETPSETRAVIQ